MAEVLGEARHLRVIGVADEKRGAAGEQDHRNDDVMPADVARGLHDVGEAAHRAPRRSGAFAKARTEGALTSHSTSGR